ncbi:MAG: glycosyltransferase family 1 protein [Nitrospiraceae bacterium]|nr:MAG: glycosyltransferase family 1 protein [Nitrospiraceae bacterium]
MKIAISSTGGTHRANELASELYARGLLDTLFIPFYSHKHPYLANLFGRAEDKLDIAIEKIKTNLSFSLLRKARSRLGFAFKSPRSFFLSESFDKWVASAIAGKSGSDANIVMAEGIVALHTIRKAKQLGMVTMLDTTNTHILNQSRILEEEYERLGIKYSFNPSSIIEKGLREYEEADYITVRSSFSGRTFSERGIPDKKLFVVPSGISMENFRQIKKDDDIFRVIYCGLSCVKKGTHYLLQAFKELSLKNAELWLIGNVLDDIKPLMNKFEGSSKSIPFIKREELYKYYSQGSVFVMPSLEEGLAKVIMEAMACGLPVIATANTGAEDIFQDSREGFIISAGDVEALKEKMLYMYNNRDVCREMGQAAKKHIQTGFTIEAYAERMIDTFNITLNQKGKVRA